MCGRGRPGGKPGAVPNISSTGWWLERCAGSGGCTEHREQNVEGEQLRKGGWKGKLNSPVQKEPKQLQFAGASKLLVNTYDYHGHWRTDFSPESSNLLKLDFLQNQPGEERGCTKT